MKHFDEIQISAYLDKQLDPRETRALETHLNECESCRSVCAEMSELNSMFREAERLEPSPFLWNRIAAEFESTQERSRSRGWISNFAAGWRRFAWSPALGVAAFGILMFAGIAVFREVNTNVSERAALAEIDAAYRVVASQDPESFNPFRSATSSESDFNPFRDMRRKGSTDSDPLQPARH